MDEIDIYTDGACSGNPGPGGWGALLRAGPHEKELWGGEPATTNNRMELLAVIRALEALKRPVAARETAIDRAGSLGRTGEGDAGDARIARQRRTDIGPVARQQVKDVAGNARLVQDLATSHTAADFPTIAIISPYRGQIAVLKEQLEHATALQPYLHAISVNTIDSFQGQEKETIILSLVRSNDDGDIGFLKDYRRMNVAITRAKEQLFVIGDSATIGADSFYNAFLTYIEKFGNYRTVWEFEL